MGERLKLESVWLAGPLISILKTCPHIRVGAVPAMNWHESDTELPREAKRELPCVILSLLSLAESNPKEISGLQIGRASVPLHWYALRCVPAMLQHQAQNTVSALSTTFSSSQVLGCVKYCTVVI